MYVSGLGYYELYINNKRIGDYRLDPGNPFDSAYSALLLLTSFPLPF